VLRWLQRDEAQSPSPFYSLRNGMGSLLDALTARLPEGTVRLRTPVERITRANGRWQLHLARETLEADSVVLATPANVAARLVPDASLREALVGIPYVSTSTVFFAFDRDDVEHDLDGVGFIVPRGEGRIIAATWVSSKWAGRAPEGQVLMRAFVGGSRQDVDVEHTPDATIVRIALDEMRRLMGPLGEPRFTRVFKYVRTNSQPIVGHAARLGRIAQRLEQLPGLFLAGGAYEGVGIPDCVKQGRAAAARALESVAGAVAD
jgi:oxygen-dependent protoporphyrinogen oxidase